MRHFALYGTLFCAAFGLSACGDNGNSAIVNEGISSSSEINPESSETESSSSANVPASSASNPAESSAAYSSAIYSSSAADSLSSGSDASSSSSYTTYVPKPDTVKISYSLKPFEGPLANPHKGFTLPTEGAWAFVPEFEYGPYGSLNNRAWDLITYGSGYQKWKELNPGKGVYDWSGLEKLLNALDKEGLTYALRVFPYTPSFISGNDTPEEKYDWTPQWVYNEGAKKIKATLQGKGYQASVPVWDDPIYLQAAKDFGAALAAKYDGDPRIEYIDIRSFGEWGEWHTSHLEGSEMPSDSIQKDMLKYYASLFKKTLLVLPSSGQGDVYTYALNLGITKRDDGYIGIPGRPDSLVRAYKANLPTIAENIAEYATMLNYTDVIPGGYLKWTPERWVDAITTAHLTYYVLDQGNDCGYRFYQENKALADSMTHVIGYNFSITKAEQLSISEFTTRKNVLNITVKNTGIAPCFFDLYMVAEITDSTGAAHKLFESPVKIPKGTFRDGDTKEFTFTYVDPTTETGTKATPIEYIALSLYESEEEYKAGKNPTVRFDNDGILDNKKLLMKSNN